MQLVPYRSLQIDSEHCRERQSWQDADREYVPDLDDQHDVGTRRGPRSMRSVVPRYCMRSWF